MTIEMNKPAEVENTTSLIEVTPEAVTQLRQVLSEDPTPNLALRVFVEGSRASMALDDLERPDDIVMNFEGLKVLVDPRSAPYLVGATIGYSDSLMERGFTIENANLPSSGGGCCGGNCGCGK